MTAPAPEGPVAAERIALQSLMVALQVGQSVEAVADALLAFADIATEAVKLLLHLPAIRGLVRAVPAPGSHVVIQNQHRQNLARRAAYLVSAARRLTTVAVSPREGRADRFRAAVKAEKRYLQDHLAATGKRVAAAEQVEAQITKLGPDKSRLLGWYSVIDGRTSPECRRANGRNFDPTRIPRIGYPGTVHPDCRCKAGPAHRTANRVERVRPDITQAVAGRAWGDLAVRQGRLWSVTSR